MSLTFLLLFGIVAHSCSQQQEDTKAAVKPGAERPALQREDPNKPIEVLLNGKLFRSFTYEEMKGLQEVQFSTGQEDVQSGYLLSDVLQRLGIRDVERVGLYGKGRNVVVLKGQDVEKKENKVLLGLTHRGTVKVVAGNHAVLNRDGWIRHLYKIDVTAQKAS